MKNNTVPIASLLAVLLIGAAALTGTPAEAVQGPRTITVPDDYQRIQDAVNAANPGDIILVKEGTYNEDYITLDKSVYLFGENQKSVIIYHSSLGFVIRANDVQLAGFTIKSNEHGQGHAVDLADSRGCIIEGNLIEKNIVGISVYGSSSGNTLHRNVLSNNERSIELIDASSNTISHNNITDALVSGISLDLSSGNIVNGNRISDLVDGMGALMLWKSSNNMISRNYLLEGNPMLMIECTDNILTENYVKDSDYGMVVGASSGNSIYGNYFINITQQQVLDTKENGQLSENSWDNGKEGNYWSSYKGLDNNADGIGDSPYFLYDKNQDNYPLVDSSSNSPYNTVESPKNSSAGLSLPTEAVIGIVVVLAFIIIIVAAMKLKKTNV
jgi:parallel beta-helix repeat protein